MSWKLTAGLTSTRRLSSTGRCLAAEKPRDACVGRKYILQISQKSYCQKLAIVVLEMLQILRVNCFCFPVLTLTFRAATNISKCGKKIIDMVIVSVCLSHSQRDGLALHQVAYSCGSAVLTE